MKKQILFIFFISMLCATSGQIPKKKLIKSLCCDTVDSTVRKKFQEAFSLVKRYAEESTVMPKKFSDAAIRRYSALAFGYTIIQPKGTVIYYYCDPLRKTELGIYLADGGTLPDSSWACTLFNEILSPAKIIFDISFVQTRSIIMIASVLRHEMSHLLFNSKGMYQSKIDLETINEQMSYQHQISFLVWVYKGAKAEENWQNGAQLYLDVVPNQDTTDFINLMHKYYEINEKTNRQKKHL